MPSAHIFTGGDPVSADRSAGLPAPDLVLAADSGAELAAAAGRSVDVLVGDLDSIAEETLDAALADGAVVEAHPADKDATDLELALDAALQRGADEIVVIGGGGGRLDHLLGNAAVISSPALRGASVRWVLEHETAYVVHGGRGRTTIPAAYGTSFSAVPMGGNATGVTISGAKWDLSDAVLKAGSSLGVSNQVRGTEITVEADGGALLVILREEHTVTLSYRGQPAAEVRPVDSSPVSIEERLDDLTRRGVLAPAEERSARLRPAARREGALERFLTERGD